ncbi:MAG: zinc ribbon domain-containing protein [Promethearchaeota archaeon]
MKRYWWLFAFFSGLLALIGVLTPVATFYTYLNIWMWGLVFERDFGNQIEFINNKVILITGISTTIVIIVCSVILILTGYLYHRNYFNNKNIGKLWICCGVFILGGIIISLISLNFYTYNGNFPYGIWRFLSPGFGTIGPIMGGILATGIGSFMSYSETGRKSRRHQAIPLSEVAPKSICPFCGKKNSLHASFCSKCGKSLEK